MMWTDFNSIIFVHGLRGHALETWSKGLVCWPRDFLKDDIPNARIITWGYDSSVADALKFASKESIFGHSETLLGDIAMLRRDKVRKCCIQPRLFPTIFSLSRSRLI